MIKRLIFIVATIFIFINSGAQDSGCSYLVWSDEFDYTGEPEVSKWGYDIGGNGWGNQELQNYTDSRANSFVKDGKLTIKALKSNGTWTSARLVTKGKGDWLYGRIEVKAKLPSGVGTWPAIWMLPTDWVYGNWPKSGEIDIMEHVGYDMGKVHGTIHTEAYNHSIGTQLGQSVDVENVDTQFHVYAIDWTENQIIWYVDGSEYFRVTNPDKTYKEWPFDKRFHLLLNIAIGGSWGGAQGVDSSLEEATMEVDYVRIYQKKLNKPVINGKKNVNPGEILNFSTKQIGGVFYKWSFPEDVELIEGSSKNEVKVKWGDQNGNVRLKIFSECDTLYADSFYVSVINSPSGSHFEIPIFDNENNILWQPVPGNTNEIILSGTETLRVNYSINTTSENPYILYDFAGSIDLSNYRKMEISLKISDPPPGSFRIDLVDVNGNVNLNDLFKIAAFQNDGEFHTYVYEFGKNPNGIYDLSAIKSVRIYINYGLFGKKGDGQVDIKSIILKNTTSNLIQESTTNKLTVWPNPFSDFFSVKSTNLIKNIELYNSAGQLLEVWQELNLYQVRISPNSHANTYFLKVIFQNGISQTERIIQAS